LQEVLIGTPRAAPGDQTIEGILIQLRERQIARERVVTYQEQEIAATQERSLNEAKATALMQTQLTNSKVTITIKENDGAATVALAKKKGEEVEIMARANAERVRQEGAGEASKIEAIGFANAEATKRQVDAYGGPQYRLAEITFANLFKAIQEGKQDVVPKTLVVNGGGGALNGLITAGLAGLMPKIEQMVKDADKGKPEAEPARASNGAA
jgi:uncharacterized membrane protein YqiK